MRPGLLKRNNVPWYKIVKMHWYFSWWPRSEDQLRTLHEIMGSNQSVWTSNIEDIEMATFKWILGHFSCSRKLMDWKQQENLENVFSVGQRNENGNSSQSDSKWSVPPLLIILLIIPQPDVMHVDNEHNYFYCEVFFKLFIPWIVWCLFIKITI